MLTNKLTGAGAADKTYIEDVFSTYLYTGNGSTQTINNGIDLAGKGGMVWIKDRTSAYRHNLFDTSRGATKYLDTSSTYAENGVPGGVFTDNLTAFNSNGFTLGADTSWWVNHSPDNYVSWTFRKAPKFFDMVTYTGNGTSKTFSHSLGATPGMVIIKAVDDTTPWPVYQRATVAPNNYYLLLNSTGAAADAGVAWCIPTDTQITVQNTSYANTNGKTYVAYLFAHDTTTDGLIQCGSIDPTGSDVTINLGWEPQYVMFKRADSASDWFIVDNMRGMTASGANQILSPNLTSGESGFTAIQPTATGFVFKTNYTSPTKYIYMAIRRGPMRTPTDGTKVFQPLTRQGSGTASVVNTTITPDLIVNKARALSSGAFYWLDRLRDNNYLQSTATSGETAAAGFPTQMWDNQTGYDIASTLIAFNSTSYSYINYAFRRAPGFFDVVCYTGTGAARTVNHNLGVVPELMIVKKRSSVSDAGWLVFSRERQLANPSSRLLLNTNEAEILNTPTLNFTVATSTTFSIQSGVADLNATASTYVAYLFASCPGVSKVGSYTGNGSSQTINCGFTGGARFVLIKRTDSTGDWYCWDTARGIVAGNDPHLSLNTNAAEVTSDDTIDPDSSGFIVNQVADTNVNVSGGSYIYLAIA